MMSGESESKKPAIDERYADIQQLIKRYPDKIGLGALRPINETNRYLTMSAHEQRKLSAEECGEAAVVLNQAATYIQLEINQMKADIKWCEKYIDWLIASSITNTGSKYTPFEYRKVLAIRQNDVAMKFYKIITDIEIRVDWLAYMPTQIKGTAASFADLQQTKRSQRA
jgi:hypothetical protein